MEVDSWFWVLVRGGLDCFLAGWVTEGESAFGEMSGSAPKSVHQQALRGIARVLLEVRSPPPTPSLRMMPPM